MNSIKTILILLLLIVPLCAQDLESRLNFREMEKKHINIPKLFELKAPTPIQQLSDVTSYLIDLDLDPDQQLLTGIVSVNGKSLSESLDQIEIDIYENLIVDSVSQSGSTRPFTHSNGLITIDLVQHLGIDETFSVQIFYHGNPAQSPYQSFGWSTHGVPSMPVIWTLSEPYGSPAWWPCKDDPKDKADSVSLNITVPSDLIVASNGILTNVITIGDRSTYHWETRYPISTYLVSLAISNYERFSDWYVYSPTDSMEVTYFVYPEHLSFAIEDFNVTVEMLGFFASVFGEYPFLNEKYGMAVFPWGGGMEHQTLTSYGAGLIRGNHRYDYLNAHEIAHQWFGDCITMRHWSDIWLNEGFASYAEALWFEHLGGEDAYYNYINIFDSPPLQGSLFVTDSLNDRALFSRTVYDKGAYVLHMLRGVLGDSVFFDCIKSYAIDPDLAYGTATTEDFQRVCEEVSGIDLEWFFEEWIYRSDRPDYVGQWSVSGEGPYTTTLNLSQENAAPYKMPLQVHLSGDVMDTIFTIWDSQLFQQFQFVTLEKPTTLTLDPYNWVLKFSSVIQVEEDLGGVPEQFEIAQNYPNPFNPKTIVTFDLPQNATVTLEIYNVIGQKVYQEIKDFPAAYHNSFIWRGQNNQGVPVPSGMYFYRVSDRSNSIIKKMVLLR